MRRDMYGRAQVILALAKPGARNVFTVTRPNTGASFFEMELEELDQKYRRVPDDQLESAAREAWETTYALTERGCMHGANCERGAACVAGSRAVRCCILSGAVVPAWGPRARPRTTRTQIQQVRSRHARGQGNSRGRHQGGGHTVPGRFTPGGARTRRAGVGGEGRSRKRRDAGGGEDGGGETRGRGTKRERRSRRREGSRGGAHARGSQVCSTRHARAEDHAHVFSQTERRRRRRRREPRRTRRAGRNRNQNQNQRRERRERRERRWVFGGEARARVERDAGGDARGGKRAAGQTPFSFAPRSRADAGARARGGGSRVERTTCFICQHVFPATALNTEINAHVDECMKTLA